ncbi:MAG: hypothetical protein COA99_19580 [Moraxellaceae bacterium]|nr:MAG: hypothetical protein COA99_19580 [Moraxellaceae bacterium]
MSYNNLPTKKKQLIVTIGTLISYGVIFYGMTTTFDEIDDNTKLFLTQYGMMVIFTSAVLAGIGFTWSEKVHQNRTLAESEIKRTTTTIDILKAQERQLNIDLGIPGKKNYEALSNAKRELEKVNEHPEFVTFSGQLSLFVLGVGSMMCIVGAG